MSQLWFINGQWLNIEQVKKMKEAGRLDKKPIEKTEEVIESIVETEPEEPVEEKVSLNEVLSSSLPDAVLSGDFVEEELYGLTVRELMEIAKRNNIHFTGIPNKKKIVESLMQKNGK